MARRNDIERVVRMAEEAGLDVTRNRRGHYHFRKDGRLVAIDAGTPSDYRGLRNTVARLRKAGVDIPHRGK